MRISDWSSDVCSSDLADFAAVPAGGTADDAAGGGVRVAVGVWLAGFRGDRADLLPGRAGRHRPAHPAAARPADAAADVAGADRLGGQPVHARKDGVGGRGDRVPEPVDGVVAVQAANRPGDRKDTRWLSGWRMVVGVAGVWQWGVGRQGFGAIVLTVCLVALAGSDRRTQLLPDQLTLPLMWLGLIASVDNLYMPAKPALVGAVIGYLSLWTVWWLFKQLTGKEGMGHGDFKLLAALGAWIGLQGILPTILLSSLVGAIVGSIWLGMKGRDRATPIPFGPYLAVAGWVVFMWGEQIIGAYRQYAGI